MEDSEKHSVGPQQLSTYSSSMYKANVHHMELYSDTRSCNNEISALNKKNLFLMDMECVKNPFLEMSQDQIEKLDEVLQSEQAKALLQETTGKLFEDSVKPVPLSNQGASEDDQNTIPNSLESIGVLSDLENLVLEQTVAAPELFAVPNDEEVVNIASDMFHEDLDDSAMELGVVLMDHSYSLNPTDTSKEDLTDDKHQSGDDTTGSVEAERENTTNGRESGTQTPPVRRSQRQIEKIEREQLEKIKAENAELQRREKEEMERLKALQEAEFLEKQKEEKAKLLKELTIQTRRQKQQMEEKIKEENVEKDISDKDFKSENEPKDTKFSDSKKQNKPVNDKENESEMQNKSKRTGRKKTASESEKSINEFESKKEDKDEEKNAINSVHKENKSKGSLLKHKKRGSCTSESEQSVDLETEALAIKGNEKDVKVMQNQKVSLRKQNRVNSLQRKKSLSESEDSKIENESEEGRRNRRVKGGKEIENDKDKVIEQKNNKTEKSIEKEQKMQFEDSKNKKQKKNESKRYRKDSSDEKKKVNIDDEDVRKPERRKSDNKEWRKSLSILEETNNEKYLSKYGAKSDFLHDNKESNPQTSDLKCIKSKSNKSQRKGVRRESHSSSMELFEPALFSQPDVMVKIKTPDGIDKKEEKDEFLKEIEPDEEKMKDYEINKDVHKDDVEKNSELENIENELKRMEDNMLEVKNQDLSPKEEDKDCKLNNNEVMRDLNYEKLEKEIIHDMHLTQKTEVLKHENTSTNEKNSECLDKGTFLQNYDEKYVEENNISLCKENNLNLDISTFHSKSNTHEILQNVLSETSRKEDLKDVQKKNILTELPEQINVALKASENCKSIDSSTNGKNNLNKSVSHSPDLQIERIPAKSENLSSVVFETMADIEQALQEDLHINNVTKLEAQSKELKNEKALSAGKCKSIKQSAESIKPERKSPRKHQKRKQSNEEKSPEKEILSNDMARNKVTKIAQSPRSKRMKTMPKRESAQNENEITKKNDEDDTDQFSDDPDDSDWSSEDDPEKLWCICRKPHDHRFMIQCDSCQDWFHGSCVGVSRQQGRQLEKQQKEWKCPKCTKVESSKSFPAVLTSTPKAMRKTSTSEKEEIFDAKKIEKEPRRSISKDEKGKAISPGLNKEKKIVIKSEKIKEVTKLEKEKVFHGKDKVLKEKILKLKLVIDKPVAGTENEKTISPKVEKDDSLKSEKSPTSAHVKNKNIIISKDAKVFKGIPKTKKSECIACQKPSQNNWSYCNVACLEKYAAASLKLLQEIRGPTKATEDLSSRKVVVLERHTGKLIAGANAPLENNVIAWLKEHPTYEVLRPTPPSATRKEQISQKIKEQVKKPPVPVEKKEANEGGGPEPVRLNVRKTLKAILESRCEGSDDAMVPGDEISKISVRIEEELYKLFKDTNSKYKSKYRSLMFNIKDPRNQGLFRKIVKGKLPPDRLVRMTPEELASTELAKWREKENQHVLDMIKREQLEQQHQAATAHITKKTHKGEVEIEGESIGVIEQSPQKIPTKFVEEMAESETQELLKDTTVHHRSHLFDLNCKICTGKVAPPPPDEPIPKKVRVAHSISVDLSSSALDQVEKSVSRIVEGESPPAVDTSDDPADREPSSTVSLGSPDSVNRKKTSTKVQSSVWKGFIFMQDVAKFVTSAYKVSGPTDFLSQDIPDTIQVCGRIIPDQVWEYICKIKEAGNKELIIIRFQAANEEENITYSSFYSYLNSRKRYGVVNSYSKMIKDFYILPLAAHSPVPSALLPFDGPGLDSFRPHLLLGVIVRHKTRPLSSATQSADEPSEEIDVCEGSYTPPLENRSYTPPLPTPASPDQPAVSSSVPSYNPSRELRAATLQQQLQSNGSTPVYAPSTESKGVLKRINDDDDEEYEPSYTPPLEKMPKIEGNSAGGKDDDANKPYDPEEFMKSLGTAGNKKDSQDIHSLFSGFNAAGISEIMQKLSKKSNSSEIPSSFLASLTSKEDIDKKKAILMSLTQKSDNQEKHVDSTKDITVNKDGMSPHTPERPAEIQSPSPNSSDTLDPIQCVSSSAMTSFFDLPENLQEILNTVRLKSFEQEKLEKDAKEDTDIRCFSLFSSEPHHDTDASERSVTDVDDKSSSQGGSPFPYDDNSNSVLRPSDPRIKIRTSFHDPVYCSDEPIKSSLSTMSASELLEKAQKQLEEMEAIEQAQTSQKSVIDSNSNIAGSNYDEELHVKTWEQLKEPPPPGIDPVDLSSVNVAFKGNVVGSESQITVLNHAVPQPFCTTSVIPDSHIVGPPFIPPPTPTAFPQLPPSYPPPPQPQNIEGFPSQPPVVGIENFPPPAPPGSQPPAYPQIQASLPPERVDNQNNEPWRLWQSPGQPPTDIDWRDRPPHWEENRWGDWDHRDRSRPPRERRSSEYHQERESYFRHEREMPDWHSGRNPEEWQYDRDHPHWREREREWSDSGGRWDGQYQENQYHRWHRRYRRGVKRDKHWRGRRRNFEHGDGYYD